MTRASEFCYIGEFVDNGKPTYLGGMTYGIQGPGVFLADKPDEAMRLTKAGSDVIARALKISNLGFRKVLAG